MVQAIILPIWWEGQTSSWWCPSVGHTKALFAFSQTTADTLGLQSCVFLKDAGCLSTVLKSLRGSLGAPDRYSSLGSHHIVGCYRRTGYRLPVPVVCTQPCCLLSLRKHSLDFPSSVPQKILYIDFLRSLTNNCVGGGVGRKQIGTNYRYHPYTVVNLHWHDPGNQCTGNAFSSRAESCMQGAGLWGSDCVCSLISIHSLVQRHSNSNYYEQIIILNLFFLCLEC